MNYVILGASAAGLNAVRELRRLDRQSRIILISKETQIYSRCILHHYLSGSRTEKQLNFIEEDFEERYQVEWKKGRVCTAVISDEKKVILDGEEEVSYDKLLIATGTSIEFPAIENLSEAKNVSRFKSLEDAIRIKEEAKKGKRFLVLGAGVEGMNCITGLLELGVIPVIVEKERWMMIRRLDEKAAKRYQDAFAERGVEQHYGVGITSVTLNEKKEITKVILTDGKEIDCDFLIITVERKPNVDFLENSDVEVNTFGLVYDEYGETSDEDVFGAGDVSGLHPVWAAAVKEGIAAANGMYGNKNEILDFFESKSTINYLQIPTFSLGNVNIRGHKYTVETEETKDGYKKIIHQNGKIEGALIQGELSYCTVLQQLISLRADISKIDKSVFEITYSDFFHAEDYFSLHQDYFY